MESGPKQRPSDQAYFDIDKSVAQRRDAFFRENANVLRERDRLKERVVEEFLITMEERSTHPMLDNQYGSDGSAMVQELIDGKVIAVHTTSEFPALLVRIGQEYRLTPEEIDVLVHRLFVLQP